MAGTPERGIDFNRTNAARMYDYYYLGGAHNFAVDHELAHPLTPSRGARRQTSKTSPEGKERVR